MSCVSTPTATQFGTFTTEDVSTSLSQQVTTLAPTTSTILSTICPTATASNSTIADCTTSTILTTIDGGTSTITVPVPITVTVTTSSPTATLFSTSCGDNVSQPPSTSTTSSTVSTPPTSSQFSSSTSTFTSTTISSSTSVNADGSTIIVSYTSTFLATSTSTQAVNNTSSSSTNVTPIAAGVAGGVGGLVLLAFVYWFCFRRKRRDDYLDDIKFPPMPDHHGKPNLVDDLDVPPPDPYPFGHPSNNYANVASPPPHNMAAYPVGPYDPPIAHQRNPSASAMSSNGTNPYTGYVSTNGTSSPPPTTPGSEGIAHGPSNGHAARPMLSVANPGPNANMTYPPDVKDRTLYLRADTGYEYHEPSGAGSSSAAIAQQQGGSSTSVPQMSPQPVIQHQDGGLVQHPGSSSGQQEIPSAISNPPSPPREDPPRPSQDANNKNVRVEAPPAYSE
ncbi:hypothetical protein QCA50_003658 [Cerrena zonata]|uniref:Uncharacterized protein n=1 Tax=Cerrena zonata TaxID=2478898 RepID=A0AAW0GQA4_9APHY